tara:strand:- start:296 stop:577 length:282 start_codon:yes stop_codon:yes gene_type:complete
MSNNEFYNKIHNLSTSELDTLKKIIDYEIALKPHYEIIEKVNRNKKDRLKNSTTDELLDKLNIIEEDLGQTEFIDKVINRLKDEIKTELSLRT